MRSIGLFTLLAIAACAEHADFEPTTPTTTTGQQGHPAASYEIRARQEREPHAQVSVWSRGATRDGDRTIVTIAFEIKNTGGQELFLNPDELRLDVFSTEGTPLPGAALERIDAERRSIAVPPAEAARMEARFVLPAAIDPDRLGSLRVRWVIDHRDGQRYVQFTDFHRAPEATPGIIYYDPVWALYDPFLYGPPYGHHYYHRVPVGRVIVPDRDRPRARVREHRR